jgi:hypothetical protein
MPKLACSAANVSFVANDIATQKGSRAAVTLADLRPMIKGSDAEVAAHLRAWQSGAGSGTTDADVMRRIEDLERRLTAAAKNGSGRTAAAATRSARSRSSAPTRNATKEELTRLLRFALSNEAPTELKGLFKEVIEAPTAPKEPRKRRRPADAPRRRQKYRKRPHRDAPIEVRRSRAAGRLAAIKKAAGVSPVRKLRRVRAADWKGASNTLAARQAAATLRNTGYPLLPSEICDDLRTRGGIDFRKPARDLPPNLLGSRMVQVGRRGQFWFKGETPPKRPQKDTRRDTTDALTRRLGQTVFGRALSILRQIAPAGMTALSLAAELGTDIDDFNQDWLSQRLAREARRAESNVQKAELGFKWVERKKNAKAKSGRSNTAADDAFGRTGRRRRP